MPPELSSSLSLPSWLRDRQKLSISPERRGQGKGRRISPFAEKTIRSIFEAFQDFSHLERTRRNPCLLQRLDPRAKLILALTLLLTLSFLRSPVLLGGIWLGVWFAALVSKAKTRFVLKRGWFLVLFYTAVLATPAIFNWITPGHSLWVLVRISHEPHWGPLKLPSTLAITDNGLRAGLILVIRVGASLSVVMLFLATTSWQNLLRALRCLAVPQALVLALSMTVRYIHLLLGLGLDWFLARKSRTLRATRWREDQHWLGAQVGYLFKRSQELAEDVYFSMVSRGFWGEPKVLETFCWRPVDLISIGSMGGVCLVLYLVEASLSP